MLMSYLILPPPLPAQLPLQFSVSARFQTMLVYSQLCRAQMQAFYDVMLVKFLTKSQAGPETLASALANVILSAVYQSTFDGPRGGMMDRPATIPLQHLATEGTTCHRFDHGGSGGANSGGTSMENSAANNNSAPMLS